MFQILSQNDFTLLKKKRLNIEFLKENDSKISEFQVLEQVYWRIIKIDNLYK
jgi:hypothetical protein